MTELKVLTDLEQRLGALIDVKHQTTLTRSQIAAEWRVMVDAWNITSPGRLDFVRRVAGTPGKPVDEKVMLDRIVALITKAVCSDDLQAARSVHDYLLHDWQYEIRQTSIDIYCPRSDMDRRDAIGRSGVDIGRKWMQCILVAIQYHFVKPAIRNIQGPVNSDVGDVYLALITSQSLLNSALQSKAVPAQLHSDIDIALHDSGVVSKGVRIAERAAIYDRTDIKYTT